MTQRNFLDIHGCDTEILQAIVRTAHDLKRTVKQDPALLPRIAANRVLAMIFEKPSTRTRVSFDVAMRQLGGETIVLNHGDIQIGRGETIGDTAQVLSRYVDAIMMRVTKHETLVETANYATVPVINGLSDQSHPCQILADVMTMEEKIGPVDKVVAAWVGDSNNVASSWIHAAVRFGFELRIASPKPLQPSTAIMDWVRAEGGNVVVMDDPALAVVDADCVVTDVWLSMGQEPTQDRFDMLKPYQVNAALMEKAKPDAIFMHCLPAKRGQEVTAEVIDGPQSVVFDEAENRLHAQRAILAWCFEKI